MSTLQSQETCAEESSPLVRPPLGDSTLHPGVEATQFSIYVAGDTNWPRISLEEKRGSEIILTSK
jgi:hypothetical protein